MKIPSISTLPVCSSCAAAWSQGIWTANCAECGGGALNHPCLACGGVCGARWTRAVDDSHDRQVAHWVGSCRVPNTQR